MEVPDGDVFVHAGDFMRTGYVDEWQENLDWFSSLPHKRKILVPGNHDFHLAVYPGPALQEMREVGIEVIGLPGNDLYAKCTLPNGMTLLGLPFVTSLRRWAFNATDDEIKRHLYKMGGPYDIVVSHAPVKGVLDEVIRDGQKLNVGVPAYREYLANYATSGLGCPKVWICGHIHEGYGTQEGMLDDSDLRELVTTKFYNAAMCNRSYEHVNKPMVIDLE